MVRRRIYGLCGALLLLLLSSVGSASSQRPTKRYSFRGLVQSVADGDTIGVRSRGRYHILRIYGIDTPEKRQLDGPAATAFTRKFTMGKWAKVDVMDKDRYGRLVAVVWIKGKSLNEALLAAGWAWHYKRYSKSKVYAALEAKARKARRGIWRRANPQAPWDWRRQQYRRRGRRGYRRYRRYRNYRRNYRRGYRRNYQRGYRRNYRNYRNYHNYRKRRYRHYRKYRPQRPQQRGTVYHGNVVSGVLHGPTCRHFQCRNCLIRFRSIGAARRAGYRPHRQCVP